MKKLTIEDVRSQIEGVEYKLISNVYINSNHKIEIECPKHGIFKMKFCSFKIGQRCPKCGVLRRSQGRKIPFNTIKDYVKKETPYTLISEEYFGKEEPLTVSCPEHGQFTSTWGRIKNKQGCPKCAIVNISKKLRVPYSKIKELCDSKKYTLKTEDHEIKNSKTKISVECTAHGLFTTNYSGLLQSKNNCPKCAKAGFKKDMSPLKEKADMLGLKIISQNYTNRKTKIEIECPKHGIFDIQPFVFLKSKHGCSKCADDFCALKRKKPYKDIVEVTEKMGYRVGFKEGEYLNAMTKLPFTCPKHGEFLSRYNDISQGHGCPTCIPRVSKPHQEIIDFIKSFYHGEILVNDRKVLNGRELDIYIPEFNLGIEFDGLYWHCELNRPDAKSDNKKKIKIVQEKNINFLAIFEDEWLNPVKQELIKAMIKHRMRMNNTKGLRPSRLELKKLTKNKEFKDFFDKFHIDGSVNSVFAYGLFDGDKIISCMSFRKSFSDKCWEIARFATDYNYKVHGAAGKMISEFKREYGNNEKLITYSNNRLSLGDVYLRVGFKEITKTQDPSYYYTDFETRVWRFKCKRINDPEILALHKTEKEQAEGGVFSKIYLGHDRPMYKIYDYGHKKWEI